MHRFLVAVCAFAAVLAVGTIGFRLMLDEGWSSAFYRAVVSTTLTGLDSKPDGTDAEIFTVVLLLAGVAIFLYIAGAVVEAISHGVVANVYEQRRRRRAIDAFDGHTIICGFGRVGRSAAAEFAADGAAFVVVDVNPDAVEAAAGGGAHVIQGDGTEDGDLGRRGWLAPAHSSPPPTRTRRTSTSPSRPARSGPTSSSSLAHPTRRRRASSRSSAPTGSSSRTRTQASRSRSSCSSRRSPPSSTSAARAPAPSTGSRRSR